MQAEVRQKMDEKFSRNYDQQREAKVLGESLNHFRLIKIVYENKVQ